MAHQIELEQIVLSKEAVAAWLSICQKFALDLATLATQGQKIPPIADEQARINPNGSLTIFVDIPGIALLSMEIPPEFWSYRH